MKTIRQRVPMEKLALPVGSIYFALASGKERFQSRVTRLNACAASLTSIALPHHPSSVLVLPSRLCRTLVRNAVINQGPLLAVKRPPAARSG